MSDDLLKYLLKELRSHINGLNEAAEDESTDRIEYHHSKAIEILDLLDEGALISGNRTN